MDIMFGQINNPTTSEIGLKNRNSGEMIPLRFIKADAEITDNYSRVRLMHHYVNLSNSLIDTIFNFPKTEGSIFDSISAEFDDNTVKVGVIEEKKKARAMFKESVDKGETVIYAETGTNSSKDIITVQIGNLLPGQSVKIAFSYIQVLEVSLNKFYRLSIPSTLTPRYIPGSTFEKLVEEFIVSQNEENFLDNLQDISKTNMINYVSSSNGLIYPWDVSIKISSHSVINKVTVTSNHDTIQTISDDKYSAEVRLSASRRHFPNKDFVLIFETSDIKEPKLLLMRHPEYENDYALSFTYDLFQEYKTATGLTSNDGLITDFRGLFIFLLDRSGSMGGKRIETAKLGLIYFLKSLPENSFFNIISFGSDFQFLSTDKPLAVNDENISQAIKEASLFCADLGGTNLVKPFNFLNQAILPCNNLPVRIFVLTDGDVEDLGETVESVEKAMLLTNDVKFFCLGIGNGCSLQLVTSIANTGCGTYEFAENDNLVTEKVIHLLECSMKNSMTEFTIDFGDDEIAKKIVNASDENSYLRRNQMVDNILKFISIFNLTKEEITYKKKLEMKYSFRIPSVDKYIKRSIWIDLTTPILDDKIHKIYVSQLMKKSKLEESIRNNLVLKCLQYSVLSYKTALIIVCRDDKTITNEELRNKRSITVPNLISCDREEEINIKTLTGRTLTINISLTENVESLKQIIQDLEGIPVDQQMLIFSGRKMADFSTLEDYKIKEDCTIHMVLRLRGGDPVTKQEYILSTFEENLKCLITNQSVNGLWKFNKEVLAVLNLDDEKWKNSLKLTVEKMKELFNFNFCEQTNNEIFLTLYVLNFLKKNASNKMVELKLIITKAQNMLRKIIFEYDEQFLDKFGNALTF